MANALMWPFLFLLNGKLNTLHVENFSFVSFRTLILNDIWSIVAINHTKDHVYTCLSHSCSHFQFFFYLCYKSVSNALLSLSCIVKHVQ